MVMKKQTSLTTQKISTRVMKPDARKVSITKGGKKALAKVSTIPAAKAKAIRRNVIKLKFQSNQLGNSVVVTKKEIGRLVDNMKSDLDSMSEMGEMESMRLQMAMDRLSKLMSTLSNLLKKMSDTAQSITQNLK
jgi:hypothetical protein